MENSTQPTTAPPQNPSSETPADFGDLPELQLQPNDGWSMLGKEVVDFLKREAEGFTVNNVALALAGGGTVYFGGLAAMTLYDMYLARQDFGVQEQNDNMVQIQRGIMTSQMAIRVMQQRLAELEQGYVHDEL